MIASNANNEIN